MRTLIVPCAVACALAAGSAQAQDNFSVFAGANIDYDQSGFVGALVPLPGARLGQGWAGRGVVYGGEYEYDRDGRRVDGRFGGGELALVRQWSSTAGWINAGVIGRFVRTELSPYDRLNPRRGSRPDAGVSLDGSRAYGRWRVTGYGQYGFRIEDYLLRASLTRELHSRFRIGPEAILQGDPTFDRRRLGLLAGIRTDSRTELQISAGSTKQSGLDMGGYATLTVVRTF